MALTDKQAIQRWDEYGKNIRRATPVPDENEDEKTKRIKRLKKDFVAFSKFYFPNYCTADFANFHLEAQKKVERNDTIYGVLAIAREHAKSVLMGLLVPIFEMANDRLDNMLLISHSYDNAAELLMPIMSNLENNQRLINDFGSNKSWRGWEMGKFVTAQGKSFRAVGSGQSPRGTRNEEKRPDFILIDDIDTDEGVRSPDQLKKKWNWVEKALFPCMSISGRKRFIFCGNVLSGKLESKEQKPNDSIIVRAWKMADYKKRVDILDKNGKPSWWQRYTLKMVNYMLSKISYANGQAEYFNNPITEGTVFKNLRFGTIPHLSQFRLLVNYMDASYKSTASKKGDYKALVLLGILNGKVYIIKARVEHATLANAIKWFYDLQEFVNDKTTIYHFVEVNGLQDPWYNDVFKPALKRVQKEMGYNISIADDRRSKPDKYSRIEAALEPFNRKGDLIFNKDEITDPHMGRLKDQFEAFEPTLSAHDDGPDATEGAYYIANTKLRQLAPIKTGRAKRGRKYKF